MKRPRRLRNLRWRLARHLVGDIMPIPSAEATLVYHEHGVLMAVPLDKFTFRTFADPAWHRAFPDDGKHFTNVRRTRTYVTGRAAR